MYSALEYTLTLPFALFLSLKISFVDETGKNNSLVYYLVHLRNHVSYNWYTPRNTVFVFVVVKWQYTYFKLSYNSSNSYNTGYIFLLTL